MSDTGRYPFDLVLIESSWLGLTAKLVIEAALSGKSRLISSAVNVGYGGCRLLSGVLYSGGCDLLPGRVLINGENNQLGHYDAKHEAMDKVAKPGSNEVRP